MNVIDFLLDLFRDESEREAFEDDPSGYLAEHAPEGLTAEDILAAMPGVCAALPEGPATTLRTAYRCRGPRRPPVGRRSTHHRPQAAPAAAPASGWVPSRSAGRQQLRYYTNVVNVTNQQFRTTTTPSSTT